MEKVKQMGRNHVWWPSIDEDITAMVDGSAIGALEGSTSGAADLLAIPRVPMVSASHVFGRAFPRCVLLGASGCIFQVGVGGLHAITFS